MTREPVTDRRSGRADGPTAEVVGVVSSVLLLAVVAGTVGLSLLGWAAGSGCAVLLGVLLLRGRQGAALGPAGQVTLTRAVLGCVVTALVTDRTDATVLLVVVASLALVLDAADGWVARRTATTSRWGARFDMEVDAFLLLVLSAHLVSSLGWWVLAIGALRYVFVAAARLLPWLNAPLPPSVWRRPIAALQGIVLVAAIALPGPVAGAAVAVALALLCWSFGRDVYSLARQA
ncbi:CDP-alcohol phosphatidyltransferase family protein [Allosaccharopolyspora coralli]|uniref:CDP-alcohol phosphatidyltransferase family protein n=1 Tax=Allosaccharopolyspora coralli TaxID=2665642 RepID=A0A5Q3Q424_9PSEU|nr:CDP-alcohol phosphatidyltransferase family protein [Allosaccharopolyspora coralli]QGK69073.1 CDP-alcohol phosphatidyltransferase family protein [Allosaccharopolyspora coralli]